jgi:hypothetical protein
MGVRVRISTGLSKRPWLTAGVLVAVCALGAASAALVVTRVNPPSAGASATPTKKPDLALVSSNPAPGATDVAPDASLALDFTSELATSGSEPTLSPPVAGTWIQTSPGVLAFEAAGSLPPGATENLTVPGGSDGILGSNGEHLPDSVTVSFTVAPMSTLRLQQLLGELDYLPVSFTPSDTAPLSPTESAMPQLGSFAWRWSTLPGEFMELWSPGQPNEVTTGAVMAFESQHQLAADGVAGPEVWSALLQAVSAGQSDNEGHYDFVEVSTSLPEHVDVWRDGAIAYTTLANTGIEAAPTEIGTWPVYARYVSTTMTGTNPDGSKYSDPGVPWVSYFHGGDALHGFVRSSYGYPQSLGCVEMPPSNAGVVFPYTPIGTLVTIN